MTRSLPALALLALLAQGTVRGQTVEPLPSSEEKGTYAGVLISPVPEVLFDQLPDLPRGQGVVVTHVLPDSPAARAGLKRHDVLLEYDGQKLRDCEHFARLIQADKPERTVRLLLLRGGKSQSVELTLALGTLLRIAQNGKPSPRDPEPPRGAAKGNAPPSVTVSATPLENGRLKLTVEYYEDVGGRLRAAEFEGTLDAITADVRQLPARVNSYTQVALQRIRALEFQNRDKR